MGEEGERKGSLVRARFITLASFFIFFFLSFFFSRSTKGYDTKRGGAHYTRMTCMNYFTRPSSLSLNSRSIAIMSSATENFTEEFSRNRSWEALEGNGRRKFEGQGSPSLSLRS